MEVPLLQDIVVIFALSIGVLLFCHYFSLPNIVGFLLTGILCGPFGLGLIRAESDVQILANIGIVLLLFIVGMEFSLKKITEYKRYFLIAGTLQVALTILLGFVVGLATGSSIGSALFLGFLISLSSTAIVLRILEEKRESDTPHGRVILGIMIFQDMVAIPMMLLVPILGGGNTAWHIDTLYAIAKGVFVLGAVLFSAVKLVPNLLYQVAKTKNRELFLLSVFTICALVAWATSSLGLSLSLGAFLAGLIISDSEYRTEAVGDILPFQDIFTSFFFVSIGMLLNVDFFLHNGLYIILLALLVMCGKAVIGGLATVALGMPLRTVVLTAVAVSQIGEFSFVLAKTGSNYSFGSTYQFQLFLSVALLTMAMTPPFMQMAPYLANYLLKLPLPVSLKSGLKPLQVKEHHAEKNHVIISGFGISGQNLARSCKQAHIPYIVLEMNPDTVKRERARGEPIHFGDASHESVLHHAAIGDAHAIAVVINDKQAASRIVKLARHLNKNIYIIVRTHYLHEMKEMYALGADDVIPDEFGSSVEVLTRILGKYHTPTEEIQKILSLMRVEGYEMVRLLYKESPTLKDLQIALSDVSVETFRVQSTSTIANKTLVAVDLRKKYHVTALLIKRGDETITTIEAETLILPNDVMILAGANADLLKASHLFKEGIHS